MVVGGVIRADLDGDGDHDGLIDDAGPDDDLEETLPGVIVLANRDDDDPDGVVDHMDNIVNTGDAADLAPVVIRRIPGIPANWTARLTLESPTNVASGIDASEVVRVFPNNTANTAGLLGPGTATVTFVENDPAHNVDLTGLRGGDVTLYVEGLEFAGEVRLVLTVADGTGTLQHDDRIQLKVAPLILLGHLDPAAVSYVSRIGGDPVTDAESTAYTTQRFPNATPGTINDSIIVPPLNNDSGSQSDDQWAQDEFQIGFQEAPYSAPMHVVLDSKRDQGLQPFPPTLLGPDFGHIQIDDGRDANTHDAFGNLEVSPPAGPSFPLGRIYYGWGGDPDDPLRIDDELRKFLNRQGVQQPVFFETDWLLVGHVDEFMSIIPNPAATHGWSVVLADPVLALDILTGNDLVAGGVDEKLHIPKYLQDYGVVQLGALLGRPTSDGSSTIEAYNSASGPVATMLGQLEDRVINEFGLEVSDDTFRAPVLFDFIDDPDRGTGAVAITPNLVNSTVYSATVIAPDPFLHGSIEEDANTNWQLDAGEDANGNGMLDTLRDPFQMWLNQHMPPGITATYIDNWLIYHIRDGEVHCSSNERRGIPSGPKWWEPAP